MFCVCAVACSEATEVFVKQITMAVPFTGNVRLRECRYYIDEERLAKLPKFQPEIPETYLPPAKALAVAFDSYFYPRDVPKAQYYRKVQISLEKVDDYSESAVAQAVRKRSEACQNLWFYVVSYGHPKFGETKLGPAPLLVLMDGSTVAPQEQMKGLP